LLQRWAQSVDPGDEHINRPARADIEDFAKWFADDPSSVHASGKPQVTALARHVWSE